MKALNYSKGQMIKAFRIIDKSNHNAPVKPSHLQAQVTYRMMLAKSLL